MKEPKLQVGILFASKIEFSLLRNFSAQGNMVSGMHTVRYTDGKIVWNGERYDELIFIPQNEKSDIFELKNVTIGINFHWERRENQRFTGALKIIVENEKLTATNIVSVEDYLISVISSEMSATASLELLKAHAVISRSWVLAAKAKQPSQPPLLPGGGNKSADSSSSEPTISLSQSPPLGNLGGLIWYERDAHTNFDVCADDHCQRYQGITKASTEKVRQAVTETYGEVLVYENKICDTRYSKCCGGVFEEFQNCWDDTPHPYLKKQRDSKSHNDFPDLEQEANANNWIRTLPESFCNTQDKEILAQVLNNYDQETTDFYRWQVVYSQKELSEIIFKKSGVDYGEITDLFPIQRGTSGRLVQLKIVGTKTSRIIGKELEIRRILSESHLYSSAFVIDKKFEQSVDIPSKFILTGAGWGHGVGLCQIGAAVMGREGYLYDEILQHYYIDAKLEKLYDRE